MKNPNDLSPERGLNTIHSTLNQAQSSMYLAGTSTILLLWAGITAIGYFADFAIANLASNFADDYPWFRAPLWGGLVIAGMIASSIIGSRASRNLADPDTARRAGLKVFSFWLTVAVAAWLIPALSGIWTNAETAEHTAGIAIGIVALGYVLFGLMFRPALSLVGIGIAAAFYIPNYFAGDAAYPITAISILVLIAVSAFWLRKSGVR